MARNISINRKISVLPGNIIIVPGTEPSTTLTSTVLELEIRKAGRASPAIVDLKDALALIEGSYIELIDNSNSPIQKLFVLPAEEQECGVIHPDWYEMLREAGRQATDEEKQAIATCSSIDDYSQMFGS